MQGAINRRSRGFADREELSIELGRNAGWISDFQFMWICLSSEVWYKDGNFRWLLTRVIHEGSVVSLNRLPQKKFHE